MNDLPAQAGYAAYETDPLFGALPGGHDAQQYGNEQYGNEQQAGEHYSSEQYVAEQHQYGVGQYPEQQQYAYGYVDMTGQWNDQTHGPYSPAAAQNQAQAQAHPQNQAQPGTQFQAEDPAAQQYGYAPAQEHAYAYPHEAAAAAAPTPTLVQGLPLQDPYGHYQQQPAPAAPGYEPTMQWTVPAEVFVEPQDQQTQVQLQVPPPAPAPAQPQQQGLHLDQQHRQHGGAGQDGRTATEPAPASAPYDAGWYASQETIVAPLVVPVAEPDRPQDPTPGQAPRPTADHGTFPGPEAGTEAGPEAGADEALGHDQGPEPGAYAAEPATGPRASRTDARAAGARSRRRAPAKRSALFTIAVPSACVMGVAGIAAASVSAVGGGDDKQDDTTTTAAADPASVKPVAANNKMDTQLAALSADARDFGDRASRTQERIDLKERQVAEKKKRDAEAARKEAARPKYLLPVKQRGLSAYFGQAGVNWMSVHTGIDFPVQTGTPVMAATDGTVRTQWNVSYGNMAIVTASDGTETWYCHLSSTRVRSGSVKAGDVIAYSGNTGNTTGPHLHFEVRPGGGAAIDPLPWLRSHDLDPT